MPVRHGHIATECFQTPSPQVSGQGLSETTAHPALEQGLFTLSELDRLVIPLGDSGAQRYAWPLTAERLDRLLRTIRLAEETFPVPRKASIWLRRTDAALAGGALLDTDAGCRMVEHILGRIAHGKAA